MPYCGEEKNVKSEQIILDPKWKYKIAFNTLNV